MNWWVISSLILAFCFSVLGWRLLSTGRRFHRAHLWMSCLFALQTGALVVESYQTGVCPIRGASEVLFFFSWTVNLFYLILGSSYRMSVLGIFTAPLVTLLTLGSLLCGDAVSTDLAVRGGWITSHVGVVMMSYGAGALAACAGGAFLVQDASLKRKSIPCTLRLLPPIRTLQVSMVRLLWAAFLLLMAGEFCGVMGHVAIPVAKEVIVCVVTAGYLVLLGLVWRRGLPGIVLALSSLLLFAVSLSIFFVS